jgi:Ca2+-binding RTX toxin-like protein
MEGRFANATNAWGNDADNRILGSVGRDFVQGYGGRDVILGRGGDDQIFGGNGPDVLFGGVGDDELYDFHGRNEFSGGPGDDLLQTGSTARDRFTGGEGADRFVWQTPASAGLALPDIVADFEPGVDTLVLEYIDAHPGRPGDQAFAYIGVRPFSGRGPEVRYEDGVVSGTVGRSSDADFRIILADAPAITVDDFTL